MKYLLTALLSLLVTTAQAQSSRVQITDVQQFNVTGNYITVSAPSVTASYSLALPPSQGVASSFLQNNGSGVLSWATSAAVTAGVTSLTASAGSVLVVSPTTGAAVLTSSGTSGGVPYFVNGGDLVSSGVLSAGAVVLGGGAGVAPHAATTGATNAVLIQQANGTASFGAVILASPSAVTAKAPTQQVFTSGSGTYTTPSEVVWIRVRMVGGGGGGSGSGTTGGGNGTNATGSSFAGVIASGGNGGTFQGQGGTGGGTTPAGTTGLFVTGGQGTGASADEVTGGSFYIAGTPGGASALGGAAGGSGANEAGLYAASNSGGGGGGAGCNGVANNYNGAGGGAGGFVDIVLPSSGAIAATYSYTVGAAGSAGSAGTNGLTGGGGGSGQIVVEEHYY